MNESTRHSLIRTNLLNVQRAAETVDDLGVEVVADVGGAEPVLGARGLGAAGEQVLLERVLRAARMAGRIAAPTPTKADATSITITVDQGTTTEPSPSSRSACTRDTPSSTPSTSPSELVGPIFTASSALSKAIKPMKPK